MAVARRGIASQTGTTTSITVTNPVGLTAGDFMFLSIHSDGGSAHSTPSGWTLMVSTNSAVPGFTYSELTIFYKVATASDVAAGSVTFTSAGGTSTCVAFLSAYSGARFIGYAAANASTAGTTATAAGVPTSASGAFSVVFTDSKGSTHTAGQGTEWSEVDYVAGGGAAYASVSDVAGAPSLTKSTTLSASDAWTIVHVVLASSASQTQMIV